MKKNVTNAINHSRNECSAGNSCEKEYEGLNLVETISKTAGERNHSNGYSLDVLANFFRKNSNFAKFFNFNDENERVQINELFERIVDCLDFNIYLQRKVATSLKGKFTSEQLACIVDAYKGLYIQYEGSLETFVKEYLFDFIDHEGSTKYDIGNTNSFKAKIESINQFEFEILTNLILELSGMDEDVIKRMHDFLLSETI